MSTIEDPVLHTYPMSPYNMRRDVFTDEGLGLSERNGLRRTTPHQTGRWWIEPYYVRNATPVFIRKDGEVFQAPTAGGALFSTEALTPMCVDQIKATMAAEDWPKDAEYLHALKMPEKGRLVDKVATTMGGFAYHSRTLNSVIIVDLVKKDWSYEERRAFLEKRFSSLGIKHEPFPSLVKLVPRFPEEEADSLWSVLHIKNADFLTPLYGGMVYKKGNSPYRFQTSNVSMCSVHWLYNPFTYYS